MTLIDDSAYWTKPRRELVRWLEERTPTFVEGYVGAVRLLHIPDFPARVHFVCHIVRDIYRYLPAATGLDTQPRAGEVLPTLAFAFADQWIKYPPASAVREEAADSVLTISHQVYRSAQTIVDRCASFRAQHKIGHQFAIALFRAQERTQDEFIDPRVMSLFEDDFQYFSGRAHLARDASTRPSCDGLIERFEAFERAFHSLIGPYFTGKEELDAILQDTNSTAD